MAPGRSCTARMTGSGGEDRRAENEEEAVSTLAEIAKRQGRARETFTPPDVAIDKRDDGSIILTERQPLGEYPPSLGHVLRQRAEAHPDRPLAAQRQPPDNDNWTT